MPRFEIVLKFTGELKKTSIEDLARKYILNETANVETSIKDFLSKKFNIIVIFVEVKSDRANSDEFWVSFGFSRENGKLYSLHNQVKTELKTSDEQKIDVDSLKKQIASLRFERDRNNFWNCKSLAECLSKMGSVLNVTNVKEDISNTFNEALLASALKDKLKLKPTLVKVITAFTDLLIQNSEYEIQAKHQVVLSEVFQSLNFKPKANELTDLRLKVLSIIAKASGDKFETVVKNNVKKLYNEQQKSSSFDLIKMLLEKLKNSPRDDQAKNLLISRMKERIQYLSDIIVVIPEAVDFKEVLGVLAYVYDDEGFPEMQKKFNGLQNELDTIVKELSDNDQHSKLFDISNEMKFWQTKLNYDIMRMYVNNSIGKSLNELIILFVKILKESPKVLQLSEKEMKAMVKLSRIMETEGEVVAMMEIILSSEAQTVDKIPENALSKIKQESFSLIIKLGLEKNMDANVSWLVSFMHKILCTNKDAKAQEGALKVFSKYEEYLDNSMRESYMLEKDQVEKILETISSLVKQGVELTFYTFQKLQKSVCTVDTLKVIGSVMTSNLQKIPMFWIDSFIVALKNILKMPEDVKRELMKLLELFVQCKSLKLENVSNLHEMIDDEMTREAALNTIYAATKQGEKLSKNLLEKLDELPQTTFIRNIKKLSSTKVSLLDVITNMRMTIEDRRLALKDIEKEDCFHDLLTVKAFEELIMYDDPMKKELFSALIKALPDKFIEKGYDIDGPKLLSSVRDMSLPMELETFYEKWLTSEESETIKDNQEVFELNKSNMSSVLKKFDGSIEIHQAQKNILFRALNDKSLQPIEEICEVLFKNFRNFTYSEEDLKHLFESITNDNDLIKVNSLVDILDLLQSRGNVAIPELLLDSLWQSVEKRAQEYSLNLLNLTLNNTQVSLNVVTKVISFMKSKKAKMEDIESYGLIILKQKKLPGHVIRDLENICLQQKDNANLVDIVLRSLQDHEVSEKFLRAFHEYLCQDISMEENVLDLLRNDFETLTCQERLIRVKTVNTSKLTLEPLNAIESNIITEFPNSEWNKNILSFTLLKLTKNTNSEIELLKFIGLIKASENMEAYATSPTRSVEITLHKLIEIQKSSQAKLTLHLVNQLVHLAMSNDKSFDIFCTTSGMDDLNDVIGDMRKEWLASKFRNMIVRAQQEGLNELNILLGINFDTANAFIENFPDSTTICDVISFCKRVSASNLLPTEIEALLTKTVGKSMLTCQRLLSKDVIEKLLNQEDIKEISATIMVKLVRILTPTCTFNGWSIEGMKLLISRVVQADSGTCSFLDPIYEYGLREFDSNEKGITLLDLIRREPNKSIEKKINSLAIFSIFAGSFDKPFDQLINELSTGNSEIDEDSIRSDFNKVMQMYDKTSELISSKVSIRKWGKSEIKEWTNEVNVKRDISKHEKVCVIKRGMEIFKNLSIRDVQLLSFLILLDNKDGKGRLSQINTGEGKTVIVAMLAVYKALEGSSVDVITSSSELAKPQAEEQKGFYEMFNLTVSHNGSDSSNIKQSYQANIVYGAAGAFQGDILRDEYSKEGTRSGRKCEVAIVDEVDSMLIDGRNHIVMLSSMMPAMNHLEPVLASIWNQVTLVANNIIEKDGKTFFRENDNRLTEDGMINEDTVDNCVLIKETTSEFIRKCTENHMRKMLRNIENLPEEQKIIDNSYPKLNIPSHLREFVVEVQLVKWIESAIFAKYKCEKDKNYIIRDGKIMPVDSGNTGVVQQNMQWSDGIHQFLQIKHGAKIVPESLTSNFISNISFFQRYESNIYGLTGTLGSNKARELLNKTYNVDNVIVPPFRQKQFFELTPIIATNEADWRESIIDSSLQKLRCNRGVLIITKFIKEALTIQSVIINERKYDPKKVKTYLTEKDAAVVQSELKPGEIIIATNIAGRGTDIKPSSSIEGNGGVHVCITFLPTNERVEQQNIGRTSRTGNRGTSQFIIQNECEDFELMKLLRNQIEEDALLKAENEIKKAVKKDKIFYEFCELLAEVGNKHDRKAVEERFSLWLKLKARDFESNDDELLKKLYERFKDEIREDIGRGEVIKNCSYHILKGNDSLRVENFDGAIGEYSKAIAKEPVFSEHAFYNRGYAKVAKYRNEVETSSDEIKNAVEDFEEARKKIKDRELDLQIIQSASSSEALSEQVSNKLNLYSIQKNAIENAIGKDETEKKNEIENYEKEIAFKYSSLVKTTCAEITVNEALNISFIENFKRISNRYIEDEKSLEKNENESEKRKQSEEELNKVTAMSFIRVGKEVKATILSQEVMKALTSATQHFWNLSSLGTTIKYLSGQDEKENMAKVKVKAIIEQIEQEEKKIEELQKNIKDLNDQQGTLEKVLKDKHDMKTEIVTFEMSLPDDQNASLYESDISEFQVNGAIGSFKFVPVTPINWVHVLSVAALGFAQIVSGAALTVFSLGAGSSVGMGLLTEGISDLVFAIKEGIINRTFSWASYGIQKAISIAISLMTAGMGALKDAAKTAMAVSKATVAKVSTEVFKNGLKIAVKAIATVAAKKVVSEVATALIDFGVNQAAIPLIENMLMEAIEPKIQDALLKNTVLLEMLKCDGIKRNKKFESLVKAKAIELLSKESSPDHPIWQISKGIGQGIVQHSKNSSDLLSAGMNIYDLLDKTKILVELIEFVPIFIQKLEDSLITIRKDKKYSAMLDQISKTEDKNEITEATTTRLDGVEQKIIHDDGKDIDINKGKQEEDQVVLESSERKPDELCVGISKNISTSMTSMIKGNFIAPMAQRLSQFTTSQLTNKMDKALLVEIGDYQAERRLEFSQTSEGRERIPEEFKEGMNCDVAKQKATEVIADVANGEQLGLQHLGPMSEEVGRPIKVLDEKGRVIRIVGGPKGAEPVEVQFHKPNEKNPNGHYTKPGGVEVNSSGTNNCLLDVVASQVNGIKASDLRANVAKNMKANFANVANQAADIIRLESFKPDALHVGGRVVTYADEEGNEDETNLELYLHSRENGYPEASGGSYNDLNKLYTARGKKIELNHCPPDSCYEGTIYSDIKYGDMPCMAIRYKDHRGITDRKNRESPSNTRVSSTSSKPYRDEIKNHMRDGKFHLALETEVKNLQHVTSVKGQPNAYNITMVQHLRSCRDKNYNIQGVQKPLITNDQYKDIIKNCSLLEID